MEKKDLYKLTDAELLVEKKNLQKSKLMHATLIGFLAGILIFGVVSWSLFSEKHLGFLVPMLIPVVFIYKLLKAPNKNKDLEDVLKERFLFSLLFVSFTTLAGAQSNGNFWARAQAGYGFCGTGDRSGYVSNLSAGWYFHPRFKAGLGFGYAGFDNGVYEPKEDNQARSIGIEANAYFHVLQTRFFKIEVGAGPHVQFWDWQYRAGQNVTILLDNDIRILPNQKVEFDETQLGYNVSLGLIVTPTQRLELGLWGVHQNGTKGDNISTIRAGIGFRL